MWAPPPAWELWLPSHSPCGALGPCHWASCPRRSFLSHPTQSSCPRPCITCCSTPAVGFFIEHQLVSINHQRRKVSSPEEGVDHATLCVGTAGAHRLQVASVADFGNHGLPRGVKVGVARPPRAMKSPSTGCGSEQWLRCLHGCCPAGRVREAGRLGKSQFPGHKESQSISATGVPCGD